MKNSVGRTVVPARALAPLILEWLSRNNYQYDPTGKTWERNDQVGGLAVLAREADINVRRISAILSGRENEPNVSFDTADKLLCAMGIPSAWHHELADYYTELETAPYEKHFVDCQVAA